MLKINIYMHNSEDITDFRNGDIDGIMADISNGKVLIEYDVYEGMVTVRVCEINEYNGKFEETDSYIDNSILTECDSLTDVGRFLIEDDWAMEEDY
ncbi:MAG: hypothetical protein NC548_56790 [Lachnospiraceae bacterium]|nr:hypothetical protein [Lachnospiraceae bacterium]